MIDYSDAELNAIFNCVKLKLTSANSTVNKLGPDGLEVVMVMPL